MPEFENEDDFWLVDRKDLEEHPFDYLSCFNINKEGMLFTFSPYALLPYAAGPQTALISHEKLDELVDPAHAGLLRFVQRSIGVKTHLDL